MCWQTGFSSFSSPVKAKVREHATSTGWLFEQTSLCARDISEKGEHWWCSVFIACLQGSSYCWSHNEELGKHIIKPSPLALIALVIFLQNENVHTWLSDKSLWASSIFPKQHSPHTPPTLWWGWRDFWVTSDNHYLIRVWQGLSQQNIHSKLGQRDYYF